MKKIYLFWMIMPMLGACGSGRSVQVVSASARQHSDTIVRTVYRSDTLYVADSVHTERVADTVYITRVRNVYRSRALTDTLRHTVTDTLTVVATKEVSRPAHRSVPVWLLALLAGCVAVLLMRKR